MPTLRAKFGRLAQLPGSKYVVVVFCFAVGVLVNSERMDGRQAEQLRASCERGNVVRGYLLLRAREFQIADGRKASRTTIIAPSLFPLLECGSEKRMSAWRSEEYLRVLSETGRPPKP